MNELKSSSKRGHKTIVGYADGSTHAMGKKLGRWSAYHPSKHVRRAIVWHFNRKVAVRLLPQCVDIYVWISIYITDTV